MPEAAATLAARAPVVAEAAGAVLPIEGRGLGFERGGRALLAGVDLAIVAGGLTVVMGPNGAGKSLLLRVLASLLDPDRGTVRWGGRAPDRIRAPRLGFVFQRPVLLRRSVIANVRYALAAAGVPRGEREARAAEALARASLEHLARSPARVLSGGEQQRLALARALATEPEVLFLDEPTSNLDPASTLAIETLVGEASRRGTKVVLVTHDIGQARRLADDVAFVHRGRLVERAPAAAFFDAPRSEAARGFVAGRIVL